MRIYTTPKSYIADVTLVTDISGTDGLVSYKVDTAGPGCGEVQVEILDMEGGRVALAQGSAGKVTIPEAKLLVAMAWRPLPLSGCGAVRGGSVWANLWDPHGKGRRNEIFDQRKAFLF